MNFIRFLFVVLFVTLVSSVNAKRITPEECKVCIDVVSGVEASMTEEERKDMETVETKISKYCSQKKIGAEQKKICYHLDPIKREMSRPMSFGMPAEDICIRKLNKKNPEFCSVKYNTEKAEKAKVADPEKMRISQLKAILAEHGVKCTGCLEKSDFVKKVKELMESEL